MGTKHNIAMKLHQRGSVSNNNRQRVVDLLTQGFTSEAVMARTRATESFIRKLRRELVDRGVVNGARKSRSKLEVEEMIKEVRELHAAARDPVTGTVNAHTFSVRIIAARFHIGYSYASHLVSYATGKVITNLSNHFYERYAREHGTRLNEANNAADQEQKSLTEIDRAFEKARRSVLRLVHQDMMDFIRLAQPEWFSSKEASKAIPPDRSHFNI